MVIVELLLVGRFAGSPDGVMNDAVSIKKINNRKIMSVIEDILNAVSTLCFDWRLKFVIRYLLFVICTLATNSEIIEPEPA